MDGQPSLFADELDITSRRLPGLNPGQQQLLTLLLELAGPDDTWTGSRSTLANSLGCSTDTITRRKDRLVVLGLLSVVPAGRVITYTLIRSAVAGAVTGCTPIPSAARPATSKRRWWKRPAANQLSLFDQPATRADAALQLAATTVHWMSLLVSLVIGPAAKPPTPAASAPKTSRTRASTSDIVRQPAAEPPTPTTIYAQPAAEPPTFSPIAIEPTTTSTPETQLQRTTSPIKPIEPGSRSLKFCLWRNAMAEDFSEVIRVQDVFERAVASGVCTADEQVHIFKFVANVIRLRQPTDNLPGLITSVLRGAGTPWRARGSDEDEAKAREQIRSLVPVALSRRESDLTPDPDSARRDARRAMEQRFGSRCVAAK